MVSKHSTDNGSRDEVRQASPMRLVVLAYDVAIQACEKHDGERAARAVGMLRDALNFEYSDMAEGLFSLYQWCLDCIGQGDVESASLTLRELRGAWISAEKRLANPARRSNGTKPLGVSA